MRINKIHREIIQIPSEENGNTAITQLTVSNGECSFSDSGVSNPQMINGSKDTRALIEKANENAMQNVKALSRHTDLSIPQATNISLPASRATYQSPQETARTYKHSPNIPMSPNQRNTIEGMAQRKNLDVEYISQQVTGKNFSHASSADANNIINNLKSR